MHIVDDEETVLRSLSLAVSAAGYATRVYPSAEALLDGLKTLEDGCVVTDLRMPGLDGIGLLRRLDAAAVRIPVIVMSGKADIALAVEAMKCGAADFLEKPFSTKALVVAIGTALARTREHPADAEKAALYARQLARLTQRQQDVLRGVVEGKSNKEIARDLGISPRTVENHRAEVMSRTQAGTRSELIRMSLLVRPN